MTNLEIAEVVTDLQTALSKALNGEVIREYEHLQVRAEEVVKNCSIPDVSKRNSSPPEPPKDREVHAFGFSRRKRD
jgi:hypothetical protein